MAIIKTTKNVPTPAKPAPKAPAKPTAPVAPPKAMAPVPPGKGVQAAPKPAPSPSPGTGLSTVSLVETAKAIQALTARLDGIEAQLKAMAGAVAKAKATASNVRTVAEITEGVTFRADDWRQTYHGETFPVLAANRDKNGDLHVMADVAPIECLAALPRDNDVGGEGAVARSIGKLALHWEATENGDYRGEPLYVSAEELAAIWPGNEG